MASVSSVSRLIPVLGLGWGLRLINLGQSFWLDEASQAGMSVLAVSQIWSGRGGDFHPPLFYLLAHFWLAFGRSEIWLRLLPLIFSLADIGLIYLLASRLFPGKSVTVFGRSLSLPWLAAMFLALNPFHIYYSQEFRSYSLLGFLGTWSMYLVYTRQYLWLGAANALLLYTHYSSGFLVLAQAVYLGIYRRTDLKKYLSGLVLTLILYLPWLPQFWFQLQSGVNIDTYFPGWRSLLSVSAVKMLPLTFFKLTAGRINFLSGWIYYPYIGFVLAGVFAAFRLAKSDRQFLFSWVLIPLLAIILFSFTLPQNQPFRLIYILPGLVLIFVQACARFPRLFLTLFLYIFLVGNISYFTRPRLQREQWRQTLVFLRQHQAADTAVVVKFSDRFSPFYWYAPDLPVIPAIAHYPARPEDVAAALGFLQSAPVARLFLLDYLGELTDPQRHTDRVLTDLGFTRGRTYNFEGVGFIHTYTRPAAAPAH